MLRTTSMLQSIALPRRSNNRFESGAVNTRLENIRSRREPNGRDRRRPEPVKDCSRARGGPDLGAGDSEWSGGNLGKSDLGGGALARFGRVVSEEQDRLGRGR